MASQLDNQSHPAMSAVTSASARQAAKVKGYVDLQLEKTRKQVKTIDLIAGILVLVAFTVGFLILAALIDAWIWPLSTIGRWICLAMLIGGCIAYTVIAIVPLFLKRINPDYAAKMIEEAKPSFRNSLMNYVSLRKHPDAIKPAVLDAVSRQAATDLASVPGDATVDQSKLIRLGFVLIGLTLFAVGYKVLSPKDPLQTVARILAPAEKIAQPAVVKIEDVQPGDVQVFFGEQLHVTATIRGSHRPEDVRLVYSTLDGQLTEQSILMVPDLTPYQYRAELSMAGGGIQSSLRYRVVARDGSSPDYEVIVRPNPSIAIESLVFTAPAYTKIAQRTLAGIGDIEAIEGTKVTVHAVANLPIKIATIELLNDVSDPNQPIGDIPYESRYKAAAAPIKMQSDGNSAIGRIPVTLDSSREKPFASHYRLRFVSTDGDRNHQPNVYPIRVIPDLAPEIEFRNPVQPNVEVPVNGRLAIDILASDLDFEIKSVNLNIDHQGNNLIAQKLKLFSDDGNRRVTAGYQLRPSELELKVGDRAVFFATAADNRISHSSEQPDPNISRTQDYSVTVTDWDQQAEEEKQQSQQDQANLDPENSDKKEGDENNQDQAEKNQPGDDSKEAGDSGDDMDESKEGTEEEGTEDGQEGDSEKPGSKGSSSAENEAGDSEAEGGGSGGEKPSGDSGAEETGDKSADGQGSGENSQDPNNSNSEKESPSGNQDSDASSNPDDSQNDQASGNRSQPSDGQSKPGDSSTGDRSPGDSQSPNGADGQKDDALTDGSKERMSRNASDGERMKKLQELLGDDEESDPDSNDTDPADAQTGNENKSDDRSEANDATGDETSKPGDQSQQPGEKPSSTGDPSQDQGDGTQKPDQQPADSANQPGSKSNDSSDPKENNDKGTDTEQKPGNESAADGQKNPNKGSEPSDPRADKKGSTAEDSDNNDSPREQSSKPGMDDATGEQSQDPGGEQTEKTGNESGGTDPGQSDSEGNESGKTESGKKESGDAEQAKPGQGDKTEPSEAGNKPGSESQPENGSGKQKNSESGKPKTGSQSGNNQPSEGESSDNQSGEPSEGGEQSGKPEGGKPGGRQSQPSPGGDGTSDSSAGGIGGPGSTTGELLEREKSNEKHAKKATDMVLKKLSEQRYDPDPELLDEMNWTRQDMENFLRRWEEMKRAAEQGNPIAKKKYEKSLKSLGLRPPGGRRTAKELNETAEGLSEDSAVNRPPPERVPDYNSFLKDLNRANDK